MTIRDRIPSIPPFLQHYTLTSSTHSALTIRNYLRSIATLHSYQGSAQGTPALAMLPRTTLTLTINFSFCLRLAVATCFPLANNKAQNLFGSSSHRSMSLLLLASSWDEHWSKKILSFQVYSPELYKYDMKRCNLISSALELDSGQSIVGVAVMITPPLNLPSVSLGSTKSTLWSLEQTPYLYVLVHGFLHKFWYLGNALFRNSCSQTLRYPQTTYQAPDQNSIDDGFVFVAWASLVSFSLH